MLRITLAVAATLFLGGAPKAHAEDTAQHYLMRLCDRIGVAEKNLFNAMDGVADCKQRGCACREEEDAAADGRYFVRIDLHLARWWVASRGSARAPRSRRRRP